MRDRICRRKLWTVSGYSPVKRFGWPSCLLSLLKLHINCGKSPEIHLQYLMDRKPYEAPRYAAVSIVFFYLYLIYKFPSNYIVIKNLSHISPLGGILC
jgi:hypothetical protein